jgi:hypothetical protein
MTAAKRRQTDPDRAHGDADRRHADADTMHGDAGERHGDAEAALEQCGKLTDALTKTNDELAKTNTNLAVHGEKLENLGARVSALDSLMRADSGSGFETKFGQYRAHIDKLDDRIAIVEGEIKGFKGFMVKIAVVMVCSGLLGAGSFAAALWLHLKTS